MEGNERTPVAVETGPGNHTDSPDFDPFWEIEEGRGQLLKKEKESDEKMGMKESQEAAMRGEKKRAPS